MKSQVLVLQSGQCKYTARLGQQDCAVYLHWPDCSTSTLDYTQSKQQNLYRGSSVLAAWSQPCFSKVVYIASFITQRLHKAEPAARSQPLCPRRLFKGCTHCTRAVRGSTYTIQALSLTKQSPESLCYRMGCVYMAQRLQAL